MPYYTILYGRTSGQLLQQSGSRSKSGPVADCAVNQAIPEVWHRSFFQIVSVCKSGKVACSTLCGHFLAPRIIFLFKLNSLRQKASLMIGKKRQVEHIIQTAQKHPQD